MPDENWVTARSCVAFSLLFNVYVTSARCKIIVNNFQRLSAVYFDSLYLGKFKVSPNFLSLVAHINCHLLLFLGNNVWRDPVATYATELSTWSTGPWHKKREIDLELLLSLLSMHRESSWTRATSFGIRRILLNDATWQFPCPKRYSCFVCADYCELLAYKYWNSQRN